jgi:hypothetical protein
MNISGANVGIGADNNPRNPLTLRGSNPAMAIETTAAAQSATLFFGTLGFTTASLKCAIIAEGDGGFSRSKLHFCLENSSSNSYPTNNATIADAKMTILRDGSVGIGTPTPVYRLDVSGESRITQRLFIATTAGTQPLNILGGINITDNNSNVYIGTNAGNAITTGVENTFLGISSGVVNTTGSSNVFLGFRAGASNTTGQSNVFIGADAGRSHVNNLCNVMVGIRAGFSNVSGTNNVFVGANSGRDNIGGSNNIFIGRDAGGNNTGNSSVFIGTNTGQSNTGNANLFIGNEAGRDTTTLSNTLIIANNRTSNLITGNFSDRQLGINTTAPGYPLDVSGPATAATINMTTWPRTTMATTYYAIYSSRASQTITWTECNAIDSNLVTVASNNGTYFVINRSGVYAINSYINISSATGGWFLAIDSSTNPAHTGVGAGSMPQIAVNGGPNGVTQLSTSFIGFLPSNSNIYYKAKLSTAATPGGAGFNSGRIQFTYLGETPDVTGVPF